MLIKKWILQYSIALPLIFTLLSGIQYIKGHTISYSVVFGTTWSIISVAIFAIRRLYNVKKNINCQLCNDLPQSDSKIKEN